MDVALCLHMLAVQCIVVDILINNAGIIRDRTIARISDQDWGK